LTGKTKGIIGSVLSPACGAWLRSQVSQVDELQVNIVGGSLQILGGTIPQITVVAVGAVYQGLWLGSIDLSAENIRVNLPQVVRGQPLSLLAPIPVLAVAKFTEADLQASLAAPLLSNAVTDLLAQILATDSAQSKWQIDWQQLQIAPATITLQGNLTAIGQTATIELRMGLEILDGHILHLDPLSISCPIDLPGSDITSYKIDLGSDVNITALQLSEGVLLCRGQIQVNP
jgi:LmeA-like phospholipid-binding